MRINPIKEKLKQGATSIGAFIILDHPGVAEIVADSGFDWIILDAEHGHFTAATLRGCLDALRRTEVSPLIRVAANEATLIKLALDLGPEGLVIPMVNTAAEAKMAVAFCKYPPEGVRGVGLGRAAHYGGRFQEYIAKANDNILVVLQIEHVNVVENIEEIVTVKGIDCLYIGVWDLSASMGIPGQIEHPEVIGAVEKVLQSGIKAGIPVGMWCKNEEHAAKMSKKGMRFLAYTSDSMLLASACKNSLQAFKKYCEK